MKARRYTVDQLRACLIAAEFNWNRAATLDELSLWKKAIHSMRDRITLELSISKVFS